MKRPFAQGDSLELTPTRLGRRGEVEADHLGWRVRIPHGIVGEPARVTLVHVSKGGPMAVATYDGPAGEPHASRREAPCPIHEACGGCGMQHVEEPAALSMKVAAAQDLLGVPLDEPIVSPLAFGYRAKTFALPQIRSGSLMLGARPPRGEQLIDTTGCNVLRPALEALAARARAVLLRRTEESHHLRSVMLRCNRAGETQVTLVHRGRCGWLEEGARAMGATAAFVQRHDLPGNRIHSDEPEVCLDGGGPITERYGDVVAAIPPTAFVQGNPDVAERLYERAAQKLSGRVVELYCGSGVAGIGALLPGAARGGGPGAASLMGVDKSPRAIAAAMANAKRNGVADRCRFVAGAAEEVPLEADTVLVNPPRAGCHAAVLEAIRQSGAETLVYLSCNPATLARDVAALSWPLRSVTPADMFPQTPHLELLAVLNRPRGGWRS